MASIRAIGSQTWFGEALLGPLGKVLGGLGQLGGSQVPRIRVAWPWSKEMDDGQVLEAAPKKRTSHQKKRQRQLAGNNQDQPLKNLNRCPACGHYKRAHTLCMNCVHQIQRVWRLRDKKAAEEQKDPSKHYDETKLSEDDKTFSYPQRLTRPSRYQRKLDDTESYVLRYPKTLPVREKAKPQRQVPLVQRKPYE